MNKKIKGFTLVELLAVIVILGILLVIAVPATQKVMKQSKDNTFVTDAKTFLRDAKVKMSLVEKPKKDNFFYVSELNPELSQKYDGYVWARLNDDGSKYDYYIGLRNNETGEYIAEKDFVETYTTTPVNENDITIQKIIKLPNTDIKVLEKMQESFNKVIANSDSSDLIALNFKNTTTNKMESIALYENATGEFENIELLATGTQVWDSSIQRTWTVWNDTGSELFLYHATDKISASFKDLEGELQKYRDSISTKPAFDEQYLDYWNLLEEAQKEKNYDYSDSLIRLVTYKDLIRRLEIADEVGTDYDLIKKFLSNNTNWKLTKNVLGIGDGFKGNPVMWIIDDGGQCSIHGTVPNDSDDINCYYLNLNSSIRSPMTMLSGKSLLGRIPIMMVVGRKDRHKFVYNSGKDGKTEYTHIQGEIIKEDDKIEEE